MADRSDNDRPLGTQPGRPFEGLRCLVLEDDFLIALDIQDILEEAGAASVVCVATAADALAAIENESALAFAVLDIDLGDKNHADARVPEVLQALGVPFVFLTGVGATDARARRFPQAPVIDKPYRAEGVLAALRQVLRRT